MTDDLATILKQCMENGASMCDGLVEASGSARSRSLGLTVECTPDRMIVYLAYHSSMTKSTLLDDPDDCRWKGSNGTHIRFNVPFDGCMTKNYTKDSTVTYENAIIVHQESKKGKKTIRRSVSCSYPLPTLASVKDQQTQEKLLTSNNNNTQTYLLIAVAFSLLLFVSLSIGVYCYRKSLHKKIESLPRKCRDIVPLDKWEILPEQIEYEEELGRGAFGVVHKAKLSKRVGIEVFDTRKKLEDEKNKAFQVVAVKVLKDDASEAQKEEFRSEIEQMKLLGYHQNIVSLVGCSTLKENKFLVIEYVPFGDLLQWLRRRRRMISQSEGKNGEKSYDDKDILEDGKGTTTFDLESHIDKDQCTKKMESIPVQDINDMSVGQASEESHTDQDQLPEKMESIPAQDINDISVVISLPSERASETTACGNPPDEGLLSIPTTSQQDNHAVAKIIFSDDSNEEGDDENKGSFTTNQLFCFAWQIARGMNHLSENGFVHRDLAARNVLVGCDDKVKVSDFGLMRQIYEDVYSSEKTKKLPVKWMAPESLYEGIYTIKSDVWSFGVLLWEMATLGGVPYPTLTNSELFKILNTGYRMDRPDMCCDEVHDLMTECWREEPSNRPSFFNLIEKLELLMQKDVPYLDVSKHDEASPYYNVPTEASAVEESKL